jgi:hypothetical protein
METSPLPMGCKILAYVRRSWPLSREGSVSCHTCCDTGPRIFRSHPKARPNQSLHTTHEGVWRTYSNPDPHGYTHTVVNWLIIYGFSSRSRIFHLYGDVTIAGEGLHNLGLCSTLGAFEHGGICIVPHLLWYGALDFPVSSKGPPQSVASYDTQFTEWLFW